MNHRTLALPALVLGSLLACETGPIDVRGYIDLRACAICPVGELFATAPPSCLVLRDRDDDTVQTSPWIWTGPRHGSTLEPMWLASGDEVDAALFVFADHSVPVCAELSPEATCAGIPDCLVRLSDTGHTLWATAPLAFVDDAGFCHADGPTGAFACEADQTIEEDPAAFDEEPCAGAHTCSAACRRVAACATSGDACPGLAPHDESAELDACMQRCSEAPAFASVICNHATCSESIATLRRSIPAFDMRCARDVATACVDTGPLAASAISPEWGAASRVNTLTMPATAEASAELGCGDMVGARLGTGLSGLLGLAMLDLDAMVRPDEHGRIPLLLLTTLLGWTEGETGNNARPNALNLYIGGYSGQRIRVDPASFDPRGEPLATFSDVDTHCATIETAPARLTVPLPITEDSTLSFSLTAAVLRAHLHTESDGFGLTDGTLQGYLTRADLIDLVRQFKSGCRADDSPDVCGQVNHLLAGDDIEALVDDVIAPILRGFDARIDRHGTVGTVGTVAPCTDDCDAISVCLSFGATGQYIE